MKRFAACQVTRVSCGRLCRVDGDRRLARAGYDQAGDCTQYEQRNQDQGTTLSPPRRRSELAGGDAGR
jgi:hypothetical protein